MANAFVRVQTSTLNMVILPISKLDKVCSPEIVICGVPWKVKVHKNDEKHSLAIYLYCTKNDDSTSWAVSAGAVVKLLSFDNKANALKHNISPDIFNSSNLSYGLDEFIQWEELLKDANKYVQNDKIQLELRLRIQTILKEAC